MRRIRAWHFVSAERALRFGDGRKVQTGRTYSYTDKAAPALCVRGMHASKHLVNALTYATGPIVCRVDVWGDVVHGDDKLVGRHRAVLWTLDATKILHKFACRQAEGALKIAKVTDERCWRAIRVKREWLAGKATAQELVAAWAAAGAAAGDGAWVAAWVAAAGAATGAAAGDAARAAARAAAGAAAVAAAWDAAWDAAGDAAWDAAWDAAGVAAWTAAWDAAWAAANRQLTQMVTAAHRQ